MRVLIASRSSPLDISESAPFRRMSTFSSEPVLASAAVLALILQHVGKAGAYRIFAKAFDGDLQPKKIGIGGAAKPPPDAAQKVLLCHSCFPYDAALTRA